MNLNDFVVRHAEIVAAVAIYDGDEFDTMFDGEIADDFDMDAWMKEHRETLEEAMCDAARAYFLDNAITAIEE